MSPQQVILKSSQVVLWFAGITLPIIMALAVYIYNEDTKKREVQGVQIEKMDDKVDKVLLYNEGREQRIINIENGIKEIKDDINKFHPRK